MTFEESLRDFLSDKLSTELGTSLYLGESYEFIPKDVNAANGFFYAPLEEDSESIAMMLRAASPTRSQSPTVEMATEMILVTLIAKANDSDSILEAITNIQDTYNAQFITDITDGTSAFTTQLIFYNAEVLDTPYDLQTQSMDSSGDTITEKVVNINWTMRATFTKSVKLGGRTYQLKIGSTTYTINGVLTCDFTDGIDYMPPVASLGSDRNTYTPTTITTAYNFILQEIASDSLHAILFSGFIGTRSIGVGTSVALIIDGNEVAISTNSINYIETNGVPTFKLLLAR